MVSNDTLRKSFLADDRFSQQKSDVKTLKQLEYELDGCLLEAQNEQDQNNQNELYRANSSGLKHIREINQEYYNTSSLGTSPTNKMKTARYLSKHGSFASESRMDSLSPEALHKLQVRIDKGKQDVKAFQTSTVGPDCAEEEQEEEIRGDHA